MKIERTKNAARNIFWGFIEKVAHLILPFITRTVMIKVLGSDYLGLSSLFSSILSVLSISELGIGSAIVFSMYKPIAEDDHDTLCALLNTYRKIYRIIGCIILAAGLIVSPFLSKLVKEDIPSDINLYVLYFVYLFNTVISYFLFAYKGSLFSAYQRNDLTSKKSAIINAISNIIRILILLSLKNYYAYVILIPLTTMVSNLVNAYMANKIFPKIKCQGTISNEKKKDIRKRIVGLLSFRIYGVVFSSVDSIVISAFLGLTPLAIFNNYYYIQNTVIGFLTIFTHSIMAGIGNKIVTSSKEENYQDFKKLVFINSWLSGWCAICLFCLYQPFIMIWVGEKLLFPFSTMILMVLYFLLPRISSVTHTYRDAAGLWWEDRFRPLIATVINLVLNIFLVQVIGMNGVIISTLVCSVLINIPWGSIILFKRFFNRSSREYFMKLSLYIFITMIIGSITYIVCDSVHVSSIIGLAIKGIICVFLPNLFFFLIYRHFAEFTYVKILSARITHFVSVKYRRK